jgi:hypothetical protein
MGNGYCLASIVYHWVGEGLVSALHLLAIRRCANSAGWRYSGVSVGFHICILGEIFAHVSIEMLLLNANDPYGSSQKVMLQYFAL